MPVPLQRLVSPPKHAEGYCAATRGEKGRGWLMRWLPSLAHDNGMIRDPPCGASPGTPRCPADCSSAAPNPGCRAREAGGGLGMFELSGACGPSVARQFSNPGTDRPALEPELDQRDPGTRPRRRRRIRAAARRSQHRTGHRMDCLSAGCQRFWRCHRCDGWLPEGLPARSGRDGETARRLDPRCCCAAFFRQSPSAR